MCILYRSVVALHSQLLLIAKDMCALLFSSCRTVRFELDGACGACGELRYIAVCVTRNCGMVGCNLGRIEER